MTFCCLLVLMMLTIVAYLTFADAVPLPGTESLAMHGDLAEQMVAGIDRFVSREVSASPRRREKRWHRDFTSHGKYAESVAHNRERFCKIIGVVDERVDAAPYLTAAPSASPEPGYSVGRGESYEVYAVRWSVLKGVEGEGLLLQPRGKVVADVVALPDCDWTPEMLVGLTAGVPRKAQFARRLAESGCRVLVPALIDRRDTHAGIPEARMTNQPHREFIYRPAFELGRHIIGYEVQKVSAAVDWLRETQGATKRRVGVMGYGEGGLVAFYAAAADARIDGGAVSGYLQPREQLWQEPIYRNVFALLCEFGDAEIASLIAPRGLVVEACAHPEVDGPPAPSPGRAGAAPGVLATPDPEAVRAEYERALDLVSGLKPAPRFTLTQSKDGYGPPGSDEALRAFLKVLGVRRGLAASGRQPRQGKQRNDPEARLKRQFQQLVDHTQLLLREAEFRRAEFWANADDRNAQTWARSSKWYRRYFWAEVIGRLPAATLPPRPRTRLVYDEPKFRGYEVVLDVYKDVFAYGILLVPKRMRRDQRRPVVVCQHGLEGRCQQVADPHQDEPAYHRFAVQLAERGFVTYAPQNPYIGGDRFRVLQRKLNPLKKSLFSVIVRQHEATLKWLASLPFVDPKRIGFYGLSYGGKTAMRVPALLEQYCLSICSADYDEWIWKNVSTRHPYSYLLSGEYEMPEFDLGNSFNYAEQSWLILPRPFMVERGHHDGVAPDEWVAYEYAKTYRRYDLLGLGDRTELEIFDGPHCIHGVGTFEFLRRHLGWRNT